MPVIEEFVRQYEKDHDFYSHMAQTAELECRQILNRQHIPALITSRAKCPMRLREKLEKRNPYLRYQTQADVRSNIYDLSGVRIAVYLPSHVQKVAQVLQPFFIPHLVKVYSTAPCGQRSSNDKKVEVFDEYCRALTGVPVQYVTRPSGYRATHLHVVLTPDSVPEANNPTGAPPQVEIQITSLFMHAWSEVEHDLVYKCSRGTPLEEETIILNEMKDSIESAESHLVRLEESACVRKSKQRRRLGKL